MHSKEGREILKVKNVVTRKCKRILKFHNNNLSVRTHCISVKYLHITARCERLCHTTNTHTHTHARARAHTHIHTHIYIDT